MKIKAHKHAKQVAPAAAEGNSAQTAATLPDREQCLRWLAQMLLIRRFEEKCAELYSADKIHGFLHLYIGEEAVAVGTMQALSPQDAIVSTYREHGHALARGVVPGPVMAEMFGKANGCSRGRGGSMHLFDASQRFYGGNAIVAGGLPVAVGMALADKLRQQSIATVCFFGDGAVAEGEFHESLNLAMLWQLPVLFLCENNLYAMGTALARHQSNPNLCDRARSYGMAAKQVDGMDVLAMYHATQQAVEMVRQGQPYFLEAITYRYRAHSMYDPELYRSKTEVERWKQRDPIDQWHARLIAAGLLNATEYDAADSAAQAQVQQAVEFAEAGPWEPVADLTKDIYTKPN